jgi:NDMA-dependent alcohol dehydrogenase
MKTRAATVTEAFGRWEILEFGLDDPQPGEVLVRMRVAGLCHSDKHMQFGGGGVLPFVGGHEGAGVVEAVGEGVTRFAVGDHVACSFIPSCGVCRWCTTGQSNICDLGANQVSGELANGGYRFHLNGRDVGAMAAVCTFSELAVLDERSVVKIDKSVPLEWASLVTCGVATGWGAVVNSGNVRAGDSVAIYGCGGIGSNAGAAAVAANAGVVAVIDPVASKRDFAEGLGADYVYATAAEAHGELWDVTQGAGVDVTIVTVGVVTAEIVEAAFNLTRKGGALVLTAVADSVSEKTIQLPGWMLTLFHKRIIGSLYGGCNPRTDHSQAAEARPGQKAGPQCASHQTLRPGRDQPGLRRHGQWRQHPRTDHSQLSGSMLSCPHSGGIGRGRRPTASSTNPARSCTWRSGAVPTAPATVAEDRAAAALDRAGARGH